ncbi:MAG: hypothetical protein J5501_01675 [Ruminococcus sp.]|nr:hypothetical protein [Ruminococcus sp.]
MNPESAAGMMKTVIMLVAVMLVLWIINMTKHWKAGWTIKHKVMDIAGIILLVVLLILLVIPLFKLI